MGNILQASECDHQWTDYGTLKMPEQGPPLEIESCVRCGVQRKTSGAVCMANVHIEHYFPKGYNPDDEPWKSIKAFHEAAIFTKKGKGMNKTAKIATALLIVLIGILAYYAKTQPSHNDPNFMATCARGTIALPPPTTPEQVAVSATYLWGIAKRLDKELALPIKTERAPLEFSERGYFLIDPAKGRKRTVKDLTPY